MLSEGRSLIIGSQALTAMKTSRKQILQNTGDASMFSQADSPASLFPMQESGGGQTDDRYLWPEMLRVIDEVRPTWVIGENVAGITTMVESCEITDMGGETSLFEEAGGVHRFRSEYTFTIERICRDLESKGYSVQPVLIPACAVGAPHRRDRVFIIAHNVDCGHDVRKPGEHEGARGEERISERNEVRKPGESDNVRSKVLGFIEDSVYHGCSSGHKEEQRNQRNIGHTGPRDSERICGDKRVNPSDSVRAGLEGQDKSWSGEGGERMHIRRDFTGCRGAYGEGLQPEERWRNFPTVSPVHRGNDGLPFDVDDLTISFAKWRNESLKAYGNAIVPQVMYRIFQCIEDVTDRTDRH